MEVNSEIDVKYRNFYKKLIDLLLRYNVRHVNWALSKDIYYNITQNINMQLQEDMKNGY